MGTVPSFPHMSFTKPLLVNGSAGLVGNCSM